MLLKPTLFLNVKKNHPRVWRVLLLILLLNQPFATGCSLTGALKTVAPYQRVGYGREGSTLRTRFKLIDNFASRDFKNQIGGIWTTSASPGSSVTAGYVEDEAVDHYGYALALKYQMAKKGRVILRADLNRLDISKAQALSFWFAFTAHNNPSVKVRIVSKRGGSKEVNINRRINFRSKNWQEVLVPVRAWKPVDFNRLEGLEFVVESLEGGEGSFLLDHISFFGPENVFFESLKDNLLGFPEVVDVPRDEIRALSDRELLLKIARDTWGYFASIIDRRHQLPLNRIKLSWQKEIGDYVSPTDIGLYYLSILCAEELGFLSRKEALLRVRRSLRTVEKLSKWKGFLYNYYSTTHLAVTTPFVSTVDNGWFAASLMLVKAFSPRPLALRIEKLLEPMDFDELYDMGEGKFVLGYDDGAKKFSAHHYGLLVSEARIASLVGIARGEVEPEHWYRVYRVPPRGWTWQHQIPKGTFKTQRGIRFFAGYYEYQGERIVPSWGGSLFEFLMPSLVVDEPRLARDSFWRNNLVASEIHRDYALVKKQYPVWGFSPCMTDKGSRGTYLEFGMKDIGVKGYPERGVITPYASILALELLPGDVLVNLRRLLNLYPIYGEYGFYDSVDVRKPMVTKQYLALDQAMILISITNYLKDGIMRKKFHRLKEVQSVETLLTEEKFFEA